MKEFLIFGLSFFISGLAIAEDSLPKGGDHPAVARYRHRADKVTVRGIVKNESGQTVENAQVFVFGMQRQFCPFPKVPSLELGRGSTDRAGVFSIKSNTMSDTNHQVCVIAPGYGTKFVDFDIDSVASNLVSIVLGREQLVRGRIFGPDGKPASQVVVEVRCLVMDGFKIDWFGSSNPGKVLRPLTATSKSDGSFELEGIPSDAIEVWIRIDDERFALVERGTQTGLRQKEGILRLDASNAKPIEIRLSEPVYVSGLVTRRDTGKVIPNAWVGVTFSDIEVPADSHVAAIWTQADEKGQYRVRCGPWASRVHVYAFAPPGTPCPDWSAGPVEVKKGETKIDLPITMPVGILVRGKIINRVTGEPIANAGYVHILRHEKPRTLNEGDANRMYWSNEYHYRYSAEDGTFEQPVPAAETGMILVKAPDSSYVSQITSFGEIQHGRSEPWWSVVEGLAEVETKRDAKALTLNIPLTKGMIVEGNVSGPNGEPVPNGVVVLSTPMHTHHQQAYNGEQWGRPIRDGRFSVAGCDPTNETVLYLLDSENQWGTTVKYNPKVHAGKPLQIKLEVCGSARARFIDAEERPLTGQRGSTAVQMTTSLVLGFKSADSKNVRFPNEVFFGCAASALDPKGYTKLVPDKDGWVTFRGLIPGAPYKWVTSNPKGPFNGPPQAISVVVKPGEITNLGSVTNK
jgi:hypothetical protein